MRAICKNVGKWLLLTAVTLTALTALLALSVGAEGSGTDGLVYTRNASGTGYSVTDYTGTATEVVIPSTHEGLPVTAIGARAFDGCTAVTSISIPSSVTDIGKNAFYRCTKLASIEMPASVMSIGESAFSTCVGLKSIELPSAMTIISDNLFSGCSGLTSIVIPDGVTDIGAGAFLRCTKLTSVEMPVGVKSIGEGAFSGCSALKSVVIPSGVTSISSNTFYTCSALESVTIPSGVTTIGEKAFYGCRTLKGVEIPKSVKTIGENAFYSCAALICVENGVSYVDRWVVDCDASLTKATIKAGSVGIADEAFERCTALTGVDIPSSVIHIGNSAFSGCSALTGVQIPLGVQSIGAWAFAYGKELKDVVIPLSVDTIGNAAFSDCTALTRITLLSASTTIYDIATTIPGGVTVYGYEDSTAEAYATRYGRTFVPIGDFQPEINTAKITLGSDITVYYTVTLPEQMKDAVMKFTAGSKTATVKGVPTGENDRYIFAFEGITPQMMGDNIAVSVLYDHSTLGELEVACKAEYSVEQYCLNMLEKAKANSLGLSEQKNAALITLLADTLEYGAAAQVYMNHNVNDLVNEGITGQTVFVPLGDECAADKPAATTAADGTRLRGAAALLDNAIRLRFTLYAAEIDKVSLVIDGVEYSGDDFKTTGAVGTNGLAVYELVTPAVLATELDHMYELSLRVDGEECQSYSYGFVNYLYSMQNNANEAVANMVRATRNYGLSAKAYLGAEEQ